ncbi:sensor histidine kinase [Paenibacillus alkaliterrae]|uniref:cache domain-containing sensor histidine kinase n=1 Tax=Paenibacillus alkaliterrae TaxID=320909 RepID=UPI001F2E0EB0|nr:sensor histidine kinase [Paenibacillus alkaliterrae]MCF2936951.1 sensor histidine kinase [Paenibacillus alkaliterrae]
MLLQLSKRFNRWAYSQSIHTRIILFFTVALSLLITALAVSNYQISSVILIKNAINSTSQNLVLVSEKLDLIFDNAENYAKISIQNRIIQETLISAESPPANTDTSFSYYQRYITVQNALSSIADGKSFVDAIIMYDNDHQIYDSGGLQSIQDVSMAFFDRFKGSAFGLAWEETKPSNYWKDSKQNSVVSLFQRFNSQETAASLGILQLSIKERYISDQYANIQLGHSGEIYIINDDGQIVSGKHQDQLYSSISNMPFYPAVLQQQGGNKYLIDGTDYLVISRKYERLNWTIVGVVPISEITEDNQLLTGRLFTLGIVFIGLAVILTLLITKSITRPLHQIKETVKRVKQGELDVSLDIESRDEIGELAVEFNRMVSRTKALMQSNLEEEKKRKEYELAAIQAQINPHFLYNTLESICGLAELKRNGDIIMLVNQLARFYRGILSKGNAIISVGDEMMITQHYLDILKVRYGDKLNYAINVDPSILSLVTVKLLLQPLVENSVYHGLKHKRGKGLIEINGYVQANRLYLELKDNGVGMDPELARRLIRGSDSGHKAESFGVKSTNDRIKLYFGPEYGLQIDSVQGEGTTITAILPTLHEGSEQQ